MKSRFTLLMLIAGVAGAVTLSGCNKTVTNGKLDGTWNVTSGASSTTNSWTQGSVTTTTESSETFDGSILSTTTTSNGITETVQSSMTLEVTFNKKMGEYDMKSVLTDPEYDVNYQSYYEKDVNGSYQYVDYYERTTSRVATTNQTGYFTVSGNAGDEIEKNSQIVFQERTDMTDFIDSYTYVISGTSTSITPTGYYLYDGTDYVPLPTSESGTSTNTGVMSAGSIWNVTELKKGVMNVEYSDESTTTNSATDWSSSYLNTTSWELTQE
ncbi:MAG: hypothetical protein HN542_01595 [Flavobacteriales bacterium]|jgi:hypothetical protein|nr:hypothetical protein [Flavobacteriales bacterium]MBT3963111.1 hypothetical protein [Flavobacteriales bacterium]MBT4706067.1 hypothetical protein [Flavobacteriales bacterium]MBT4930686.1 hypothetical protein [Flavobacteriales bacterium]MBT5133366.1 hypothetical protein [Flavobacteriales bacterium]